MNLPTEVFGNVVVVHAPEEVGEDQATAFEAFLTSLEQNHVVLDLDNSEMIDSFGLTAILESQDNLREMTGELKIACSNHVNRKILEITRIEERLDVFDSVIDAVKSFR